MTAATGTADAKTNAVTLEKKHGIVAAHAEAAPTTVNGNQMKANQRRLGMKTLA